MLGGEGGAGGRGGGRGERWGGGGEGCSGGGRGGAPPGLRAAAGLRELHRKDPLAGSLGVVVGGRGGDSLADLPVPHQVDQALRRRRVPRCRQHKVARVRMERRRSVVHRLVHAGA